MDIFESLRLDHAALRGLLDDVIEKSTGMNPLSSFTGQDWPELMNDLKISLIAHNRAEEAVLYEHLTKIPHRSELSEIKTEEHRMTESLLEDIEGLNPQDTTWESRLGLIKNQLESHIAEEETLVFSIIREAITDEEAEKMANEFEALRDQIRQGIPYQGKVRSALNPEGLSLEQ